MTWQSIVHRLEDVAATWGDHGLHFVDRRQDMTYRELADKVRRCAAALAAAGLRHGDNIGLLMPTSAEFYVALLGAMRAGLAPSPFAPPASARRIAQDVRTYSRVLRAGYCRALIVDAEMISRGGPMLGALGVPILPIEQLLAGDHADAAPVLDPGRDLALVQYTSGSTSHPKGVAISHAQLAAGIQAIATGMALAPHDVNGQWLPVHHDMGLIGSLTGLCVGVEQYLWSPLTFVRDAGRWLTQFAARRATVYAGPNFAYAEMAARCDDEQLAALDLSAWRVAFNGAEPVDPVVLRRFTERFAAAGLRPGVVMPVYGLAEATLAATFPPLTRPWSSIRVDGARLGPGAAVDIDPAGSREVVSVGHPVLGHELRIRLDGRTLGDDAVGEIQLRGPAVMTGYFRDAGATADALDGGWLATGDLGFTHRGELYVTGRLKEMMILHGRNYYPHDVEELVQGLPGCHRGMAVAFAGHDAGGEHMVLVAETKLSEPADCAALAAASQQAVHASLAIPRLEVVLVKSGTIPRTTSGKRQRLLVKAQLHKPDFAAAVVWSTHAAQTQVYAAAGTSP